MKILIFFWKFDYWQFRQCLQFWQLDNWLRNWLQFWQLRIWIHENLCDLAIKNDTGQHLQFLRCLKKEKQLGRVQSESLWVSSARAQCQCARLTHLTNELIARHITKHRHRRNVTRHHSFDYPSLFGLYHKITFITR